MYLFFDVGATNTRFGYSNDGKKISSLAISKTARYFDDFVADLDSFLKKNEKKNPEIIIGGCPGNIDEVNKVIKISRNLPNWVGKPVGEILSREFKAKVILKNDSALAGLGEAVYGAGRGFNIVAYLTISTGVGGARIVNSRIDKNTYGFEPGYQIIDIDGSVDARFLSRKESYGNSYGYLQRLISGKDLFEKFGDLPENIKEKKIWNEIIKYLSAGVINTIVYWSPEVVVIGGGLTKSNFFDLGKVINNLEEMNKIFLKLPEIKKSELGDFAGLYGALHLIKSLKIDKKGL